MKYKMKYKVVMGNDLDSLEESVNMYLRDTDNEWKLVGGIATAHHEDGRGYYYQAIENRKQ